MADYDLVTFGENMIRLSTRNYERLEQAQVLDFKHGGAESNVAVGLASLGYKVAWISRLADNPLGRKIAGELRLHGVDTGHVQWADEARVGLFFLEVGTPPRQSRVIYDRRHSAMSQMAIEQFPWQVLAEARWLHVTGITAALSDSCAKLVAEAVTRARDRRLGVSLDVNYRARLWTPAHARQFLEPICKQVDVLIVSENDARRVFDVTGDNTQESAKRLAGRFAHRAVVLTLGPKGALGLDKASSDTFYAAAYSVAHVVDRVGAGDAFAAGFLAGYWESGLEAALRLGNAVAALKMTIPGDLPLVSRADAEALIRGSPGTIVR